MTDTTARPPRFHVLHRWSRWEDTTARYTSLLGRECETAMQMRRCEVCGIAKTRNIG